MLLAPCGVDCGGCHLSKQCGGSCYGIKGKPFYLKDFGVETCPLYDCPVNQNGFKTCAECEKLPCELFYSWKDPSMSEEQHLESIEQRVKSLKEQNS